jgi:hypothetical protein
MAALHLLTLGLRYLWEWVCIKLQPPCPPDPCDDRIIIACVTVRDGKVVDVCNFSCRKRAGSFTARDYWLSLTGIKPLVLMLLERLCCGDLIRARSPIRNRLADLLQFVDPAGQLAAAVARDDFAKVRRLAGDLAALRDRIDVSGVVETVSAVVAAEPDRDFLSHLDRPIADVQADLERAGVKATVADVDQAPALAAVRAAATTGAQDVVLLRDARTGRVVGVERAPQSTRRAAPGGSEAADRRRVEALAKEVQTLRAELVALRRDAPAAATTASKTTTRATSAKATTKKATAKKAIAAKAATKKVTAKKATAAKAATKKATKRAAPPRDAGKEGSS